MPPDFQQRLPNDTDMHEQVHGAPKAQPYDSRGKGPAHIAHLPDYLTAQVPALFSGD